MATRFPDGEEPECTNIDSSHNVEWQIYIVNSPSSIELLTADNGNTLPPLTVITENPDENKDILFTSNLTLKGLNKVLLIHWGEQPFGDADSVQFNHQIPQLASIEVELESKEFIIVHPKSQQQLMETYTELQINPEYIGRMLDPEILMVNQILNENVAYELEVNKGELNPGLLEVLNILSVNVSTIGNLSFIDSITIKSDFLTRGEPTLSHELPFYMLRKIILHRHNCRELSSQSISLTKSTKNDELTEDIFEMLSNDGENKTLHSMDIFLLLFFQCDILYRQIFLENVAQCQCSLPLITIDPISNNLMMYDFALKKIKKTCVIDGRVEEFRIVRKPMPIVSFIRLESAGRFHSKSKMINQLLGVSHNYFFHREIRGSSPMSYLLPGTIELGWYLPKKKGINEINQHITILNLRGNSLIYTKQVAFLQNVSNMIFIYVSLNRMSEQEWLFLNELFSIHGSKCALLIEERPTNPKYNIKELKYLKRDKKNCILLTENISTDKEKIVESINYYTQDIPEINSIANCTRIAKEFGIILESESLKEIDVFPQIIENLFNSYFEKSSSQFSLNVLKHELFQLQGKWWRDWSDCQRYLNKIPFENKGNELKIDKIKIDMKVSRANQIVYLYSMDTSILSLLTMYLTNDRDTMMYSLSFFRILTIFLEDKALDILPKLYLQYKDCSHIIHQDSKKGLATASIKNRLKELEDEITNSSIGEEHIMREFAQIFESNCTVDKSYLGVIQDQRIFERYSVMELPTMAARFLLSGLPLEILDGDVSQIPTTWIKSIFQEIGKVIGVSKKVYIVSILGIQSSGKSTLLNTMFGLQFPVSAGRCTKGAFMQLVPIDELMSQNLGYDYLMVVDTEGLRGMEKRNSSSHLYDNELATFAMGLANLTVININGENQSDIHDILQITIYALIRMKKVELHPKCIFIHQNVLSDNAEEILIIQRNKLVTLLNEMTLAAAKKEDLTFKYNRFSDVISFDPKSDILYFSGLLHGEPPMAPINLGYCQDAEEARRTILTKFIKSGQLNKLHEVGKRVNEIWSCIMKDDFGFHFRNVLELNINLELEMELVKWQQSFTQNLITWECQQLTKFSNLHDEMFEDQWEGLITSLKEKCDTLCMNQQIELIQHFFMNHKARDILKIRQNDIEEYFEKIRAKQFTNIYIKIENTNKVLQYSKDFDKLLNDVEEKLLKDIMELYRMHKNQALQDQLDDEMIAKIFTEKWNELSKEFPTITNKPIDIKQQLQTFFHNTETLTSIKFADETLLIGEREKFQQFGLLQELDFQKEFHYINIREDLKGKSNENAKKDDIRCFLSRLEEECQSFKKFKFTNEYNFSGNAFKWILNLVDSKFTMRNRDNVISDKRERNYKLTNNLVHEFAFFQCCKLLPFLEEIQKTFLKKNSIKNRLDRKEEQFKTYFFSLWKGVQNEQCAANELATSVFNSICDSAHHLMERKIITIFMEHNDQYLTKYELQLNLLIELCEEESFHSYLLYILDPIEFIRDRLEQQLHSFYAKDEGRKIILNTYHQNVTKLITITIKAAKAAFVKIYLDLSANGLDTIVIPKDIWKRTFMALISNDIQDVSNTKLNFFDVYDIKDFNLFIKALSDSLSEKQKRNFVEMPWDHKQHCDEILKYIIQCRECCPYCNELCQRNIASHEHYCGEFHRPLGLKGTKNSSNKLISQPCPNLINKKGISKKFKLANLDFSEDFLKAKNWKINEKEAITTHYWVWVMNRFHFEFEQYFDASPDIQTSSLFTKSEILSALRNKVNTNGDLLFENDTNSSKFSLIFSKLNSFLFH